MNHYYNRSSSTLVKQEVNPNKSISATQRSSKCASVAKLESYRRPSCDLNYNTQNSNIAAEQTKLEDIENEEAYDPRFD